MPMGIYSGNNQLFSATTSLPDDSDALDASEVNVALEQLTDHDAYLGLRTLGNPGQNWLGGPHVWYAPATQTFFNLAQPLLISSSQLAGTAPESNDNGNSWNDETGGALYFLRLTNLIDGATIEGAWVYGKGVSNGSASVSLWKSANGGAAVQIGSTVTLAATTYAVFTQFEVVSGSEVIDTSTHQYWIQIQSSLAGGAAVLTWSNVGVNVGVTTTPTTTQLAVQISQTSGQPVVDFIYGQWLLPATDSTGTYFVLRSTDGYSWDALGGPSSANYSFGATASTAGPGPGYATMVRPSDGLVALYSHELQATFNQATQTWATATFSNTAQVYANYGAYFAAVNLFVVISGRIGVSGIWSADGITYTAGTWTPSSTYLPNRYAFGIADTAPVPYAFAFAGNVGYQNFSVSVDGKTWAELPTVAFLAGEKVVGAVWDHAAQARNGGSFGGLIYLLSSSTAARLIVGGVVTSSISHPCVGLATNHGELLTMVKFGETRVIGTLTPTWRALQSVDLGVTWQMAPLQTADAITSFTGSYSQTNTFGLTGNGGQFLYVNAGTTYARTIQSGQLPALPF